MDQSERMTDEVVPRPIRVREVFSGKGEPTRIETVFCPARGQTLEVHACGVCAHSQGSNPEVLFCDHRKGQDEAWQRLFSAQPENSERTPVRELMSTHVVCVRTDLGAESLMRLLLERRIHAVPVVDARGAPIGMLSKADLVQNRYEDRHTEVIDKSLERGLHVRDSVEATVLDLMVPAPVTLSETDTISQAAAVMAYERVRDLPIVGSDGTVVGIVSALDVVAWYAMREGNMRRKPRRQRS